MTPDERQALEALIAKWMEEYNRPESEPGADGPWEAGYANGLKVCADELAAVLGRLTREEQG